MIVLSAPKLAICSMLKRGFNMREPLLHMKAVS